MAAASEAVETALACASEAIAAAASAARWPRNQGGGRAGPGRSRRYSMRGSTNSRRPGRRRRRPAAMRCHRRWTAATCRGLLKEAVDQAAAELAAPRLHRGGAASHQGITAERTRPTPPTKARVAWSRAWRERRFPLHRRRHRRDDRCPQRRRGRADRLAGRHGATRRRRAAAIKASAEVDQQGWNRNSSAGIGDRRRHRHRRLELVRRPGRGHRHRTTGTDHRTGADGRAAGDHLRRGRLSATPTPCSNGPARCWPASRPDCAARS